MKRKISIEDSEYVFEGHEDHYLEHLTTSGEDAFTQYAKNFVPEDAVILDVGANIGFISTIFSHFNPSARIHAFEPGEKNFKYLDKNIKKNNLKNVTPYNLACGSENYVTTFRENSAWGYIDSELQVDSPGSKCLIRVTTIDQFVEDNEISRIDLIKIDVEGFEKHVFDGLSHVIEKFKPKIIFEFNTFCMLSYGRTNPFDFLTWIEKNFENRFRFSRPGESQDLLIPLPNDGFVVKALHENIVDHGSVDDFLVY
jgi:FkbM family methyltransferase